MVSVVGQVVWDYNIQVPSLIEPGAHLRGELISENPGGNSANTAAWLSLLGEEVNFFAPLASDQFTEQAKVAYSQAGIRLWRIGEAQRTRLCYVLYTGDNPERSLFSWTDNQPSYRPYSQKPLEVMEKSQFLWIDIKDAKFRAELNSLAVNKGIPLRAVDEELDTGNRWNLIVGSEIERKKLTTNEFKKLGAELVIVTQGERGGKYTTDGKEWIGYTPCRVKAKDTCGAGDAFLAGILHGLCQHKNLSQVISSGKSTAAKALKTRGSWPYKI